MSSQYKKAISATVAAALACLAFSAPASANIQQICKAYGLKAVKQQQYNIANKCNQTGDIWSTDLKAHIKFCATNPPAKWQAADKMRDEAIKKCGG